MKKTFIYGLAVSCILVMAGCGSTSSSSQSEAENQSDESASETEQATTEVTGNTEDTGSADVMSYEEYAAADLDTLVTVETYVQAKQSWYEDKATLYTQDQDGAYFIYDMACSEEDYEKLVAGTKIRLTGYKSEWSGEVEIIDVESFEILEDDTYIAEALDVTSILGSDELIDHQNQFVSFCSMTVEAANDDGDAFMYKWDGSGEDGDDLYFNVSVTGEDGEKQTYTFTVESYLCDNTTNVYSAVKSLEVGDVVDMEGFLYWYEGVNPHITSVTVVK